MKTNDEWTIDGADLWAVSDEPAEVVTAEKIDIKKNKRRVHALLTHSDRYILRRGFSESRLIEAMSAEHPRVGDCWHFVSFGDVDSLSFLQCMLIYGPIEDLVVSMWCMNGEDVLTFDDWLDEKKLFKVLFCVGDYFPKNYRVEWGMLQSLVAKHDGCEAITFLNHSKVMVGRWSDGRYFCVESSANMNTNVRTEQTVLTFDNGELFAFYKSFFEEMRNFDTEKQNNSEI